MERDSVMSDRTPSGSGARKALPPDCKAETLGVAFFDLSRIIEWSSSEQDAAVASFFQRFYELAATHVDPAGGRIVKFMGDAGLAVFPTESAENVILAMCAFARQARKLARDFDFDVYLNVNIHVGPVIAGKFGPPGAERYDVIGKTVNVAARLGRRGVTLSPQAFRCLSDEGRKRFEKIMQPITYRFRT
jgi:class 3 adenylate cyclase